MGLTEEGARAKTLVGSEGNGGMARMRAALFSAALIAMAGTALGKDGYKITTLGGERVPLRSASPSARSSRSW